MVSVVGVVRVIKMAYPAKIFLNFQNIIQQFDIFNLIISNFEIFKKLRLVLSNILKCSPKNQNLDIFKKNFHISSISKISIFVFNFEMCTKFPFFQFSGIRSDTQFYNSGWSNSNSDLCKATQNYKHFYHF